MGNSNLDMFLDKAFQDLNIRKVGVVMKWTFFKRWKRDAYLDYILSGYDSKEAFYRVKVM